MIINGDCVEVMRGMDDASVDSIVTDPPYGINFMNKGWDNAVPGVEVWQECLRVLKPGGHILAFAGTRTQHRMASAIDDAGFEIRDMIAWIYGSGFPKSHNVLKQLHSSLDISKSIDKFTQTGMINAWKKCLEIANVVGVKSPKNQTGVGHLTQRNGFAQEIAQLSINLENEQCLAIVAELSLSEARHTSSETTSFVQENAEKNISALKNHVTIAEKLQENQDQTPNMTVSFVQSFVLTKAEEKITSKIRAGEVQKTLLGALKSSEKDVISALCAVLTNDLKHIMLNQSKIFQNLDMTCQTECVSATNVTITKFMAEHLISFTVDTLRKIVNSTEGWGTALKPALEPITVGRKPLDGTVAANVLQHGTGAINIDGCRVGDEQQKAYTVKRLKSGAELNRTGGNWRPEDSNELFHGAAKTGRFPANLIHDGSDDVLSAFPQTKSGSLTADQQKAGGFAGTVNAYGKASTGGSGEYQANAGSAARFFYQAKASKADRNDGLSDHAPMPTAAAEFRPNHTAGAEAGEDGNPYGRWTPTANNHPTVKPTDLMRYLCRLVTPPGGVVLDPFAGSGSTGRGALLEGFRFIGIELDPHYADIARARINAVEADAILARMRSVLTRTSIQ